MLIILTICIWGITFSSTRVLLKDFSSIEIQLLRFSLAWLALWVTGRILRQPFRSSTSADWRARLREELTFAGFGFFGVTVCQFLENCAIDYTNASNVAALDSLAAIITALMLWLCLGQKVFSWRFLLGSVLAIAGVVVVGVNGVVNFQLHPLGDFMAIAAKFSWGIYAVIVEKANGRGVPVIEGMRRAFFWTLMFSLPMALMGMTDWGATTMNGSFKLTLDAAANAARFTSLTNCGHLLFLGVLASAVAYAAWNRCCAVYGSMKTSLALYFIPVVGVVFAMVFLNEPFTWISILGGLLILLGVKLAKVG